MPKIKNPELRNICSDYLYILNDLNSARYLEYLDCTNQTPPFYLTNDDGELVPCDFRERTSEVIYQGVLDSCNILSDKYSDLNYNANDYINEFNRIGNNISVKQYRIKKKVEFLLWSDCTFLTLTFNNDILNSTSPTTRRRYVRKYLNSLDCFFLANIDFGKKNGREHYHAIVKSNDCDYTSWHKFGAIKGKRIIVNDSKALSRYICKLTNHSVKTTTKCNRIMTNVKSCDRLF